MMSRDEYDNVLLPKVRRRTWRDRNEAGLPAIGDGLRPEHMPAVRKIQADDGMPPSRVIELKAKENAERAQRCGDGAEEAE